MTFDAAAGTCQLDCFGPAGGVSDGHGLAVRLKALSGDVEDAIVRDNILMSPGAAGNEFGVLAATVILVHRQGMAFADLPGVKNGSVVYVTDGTKGSDPLTGSSTGAIATRINGAWVGT